MTLPKKIAFFTPYYKENRGNSTTAKRLEAGLKARGISVEIFAYEEEQLTEAKRERLQSCDLFHILHFYRFALWVGKTGYLPQKPYVITAGGTDVNEYLYDPDTFEFMNRLIQKANGFAAFTEDGKTKVEKAFHLSPCKVQVIPQSVWFPEEPAKQEPASETGYPHLLLPAGLRPVKDVLFLLDAVKTLKGDYPSLAFVIIGPVLDSKVYQQVTKACQRYEWLHYEGTAPLSAMKNWYQWADVVINSSLSEGQSSALIEAMALQVPVLARKIPGNESVIQDGKTGVLFKNGPEFLREIRRILTSHEWRNHLIHNAKCYVDKHHALETEIDDYMNLYKLTRGTNT